MAILTRLLFFGLVGALGLITDFLLTWFGREKIRMNQYFANAIGFLAAVTQNYWLNRYWTFYDRKMHTGIGQWSVFLLVSLIGLSINTVVLKKLNQRNPSSFYLNKLIAVIVVFFWNFFSNNFLTFAK